MNRRITGLVVALLFVGTSLCACNLDSNSNSKEASSSNFSTQPETVIVKETILVTESKTEETTRTTEPESDENNQSETAVADSTESTGSAGYTTSDVLKKAAKAADKQYWIVYYRYNKLKMSSFNALEDFTVTLANNCLNCDKTVGDPTIYYWDDDKNDFTESIRDPWFCDEIIGGNCDVVDEKNDKTIKARTK